MGGGSGGGYLGGYGGSSGVSGRSGGGGNGGGTNNLCASLSDAVRIDAPNPIVRDQISVSDILTVEQDGQSLAALLDGVIVGPVITGMTPKILDCIEGGHSFVVEVQTKDDNAVFGELRAG